MKRTLPLLFLLALSGPVCAQISPEDAFLLAPTSYDFGALKFSDVTLEGVVESSDVKNTVLDCDGKKWVLLVDDNSVLRTPSGGWRERAALQKGQQVRVVGLPSKTSNNGVSTLQARVLFLPESAPKTPVAVQQGFGGIYGASNTSNGGNSDGEQPASPALQTLRQGDLKLEITHMGFYPMSGGPGTAPANAARRFVVKTRWQAPRPYRVSEDGYRESASSSLARPEIPLHQFAPVLTRTPQITLFWRALAPDAPEGADGVVRSLLNFAPVALDPNAPVTVGQTVTTRTGTHLTWQTLQFKPSAQGGQLNLAFTQDKAVKELPSPVSTPLQIRAFDEKGQMLPLRERGGGWEDNTRSLRLEFTLPVTASKITVQALLREFDPARVDATALQTLRTTVSPAALWKADPHPELKRPLPKSDEDAWGNYESETLLAQKSGQTVEGALEANLNSPQLGQWSPRLWLWPHGAGAQSDPHFTFTAKEVRVFADGEPLQVRLDELANAPHDFRADGMLALPSAFDALLSVHLKKPLAQTTKFSFQVDAVPTERQISTGHLTLTVPGVGQSASLAGLRVEGDEEKVFHPLTVAHVASKDALKNLPGWMKQSLDGPFVAVVFRYESVTGAKPDFETPYAVAANGQLLATRIGRVEGNALLDDKTPNTFTLLLFPPAQGQTVELWLQANELQPGGKAETLVFPLIERAPLRR